MKSNSPEISFAILQIEGVKTFLNITNDTFIKNYFVCMTIYMHVLLRNMTIIINEKKDYL